MKDRKLTAFNSVRIRYLTKVRLEGIGKKIASLVSNSYSTKLDLGALC